jgi:hypothetical protein
MAFEKIHQIRSSSQQKDLHAAFSSPKSGAGNLRFTVSGLQRLRDLKIDLGANDQVDLFFDRNTNQVALQKAPNGEFKLSRSSPKNETMRITSKALSLHLKGSTRFRIEASGKFDVVLLPISKAGSSRN